MSDERRIRRLSWLALIVLLPVALWGAAREDIKEAWHRHAFRPIDVEPAETTNFAGLGWRLVSLDRRSPEPSPGQTEIFVSLEVDLTNPEALKGLSRCQPFLEDSSGQRWSPAYIRIRDKKHPTCHEVPYRADKASPRVTIVERFLVPTARAPDTNLVIVVASERPRYLRFQHPVE